MRALDRTTTPTSAHTEDVHVVRRRRHAPAVEDGRFHVTESHPARQGVNELTLHRRRSSSRGVSSSGGLSSATRARYRPGQLPLTRGSATEVVMALLEDALRGWSGGLLVGLGAAVVAPLFLPNAGAGVR